MGSNHFDVQPSVDEPSEAAPPMWLEANSQRKLLPEPQSAQPPMEEDTAQPSSRGGVTGTPPRPAEAALRLAVPSSIAVALRPYQREGVRFLFRCARRSHCQQCTMRLCQHNIVSTPCAKCREHA